LRKKEGAVIYVLQHLQTRAFKFIWLVFLLTTSQSCLAEILLNTDSELSTEGYFVLSWQSNADAPLTLQQASSANFLRVKTTSLPVNGAITITGLENGNYFFRVISATEQSQVVQIQVRHHSLLRAFSFFGLGLMLFTILVLTIYLGWRRESEKHD
tara:strand:+ start:638 stop:1105 length:468 start_codon:yes stop_codon:yes gene_type:complete